MQNVQYFSKFAGFGLQLYYQRAPSQLFAKKKVSVTTFFESAEQLLFRTISYLTYLHERKTAAQQ